MKKYAAVIAAVAFVGMVDTFLLAAMKGQNVPCSITHGCEIVLTSVYSSFAGIPLPYFGLAFYFTAFCLAVFESTGRAGMLRWLLPPAAFGFLASLYLIYIQAFVLKAWCQYCLLSAGLTTTIFVLSVLTVLRGIRVARAVNPV